MSQSHLFKGAAYGAFLAGCFVVLVVAFDRPEGTAIFLLGVGIHLLVTGWMPWARLGMKLTTVGMYLAAAALLWTGGGWLVGQRQGALVDVPFVLLVLAVSIVALVLMTVDRYRHPAAWQRWRNSLQRASLGDIVLGRHFSA